MPDRRIVTPNDLGARRMSFKASRQFKTSPRLFTSELDEPRPIYLTGNIIAPLLSPLIQTLLIENAPLRRRQRWNGLRLSRSMAWQRLLTGWRTDNDVDCSGSIAVVSE